MQSNTVKISVVNPVTNETIDDVTMELFYSLHFNNDGRRVMYVNGTATVQLDESHNVVAVDVLPFNPNDVNNVREEPLPWPEGGGPIEGNSPTGPTAPAA